jgi:hypothetical protein
MFLAIIGFIIIGLMLIMGLVTGTFLTAFSSGDSTAGVPDVLLIVIFLIIGVINFFPVFFLFQFSRYTANAVQNLDKKALHTAFKNLKFHYVYIGVFLILIMVIYIIALIATGTSMKFLN